MIKFKNLFSLISFTEFSGRLSYYGMQALLILYLVKGFNLPVDIGYKAYGDFTALTFSCCIIGGIIADKFLMQYQSVLYGLFLVLISNVFFLFSTSLNLSYLAITCIILGIGLIKPGTSCLIGLVEKNDIKLRNRNFLYFYTISSLGSILGPLFYGIGLASGKHYIGFSVSFLSTLINICIFIIIKEQFKGIEEPKQSYPFITIFILSLVGTIVFLSISNIMSLRWLFLTALIISIYYLILFFGNTIKKKVKLNLLTLNNLCLPFFASMIFFTTLLQIYSSITVFLDHAFHNDLMSWHIPVTWFSSIEAILLFFITPIISTISRKLNTKENSSSYGNKILIGMLATSVAFYFFSLSASYSLISLKESVMMIFIANLFLAIGELFIIPVSLLLITTGITKKHQGLITGIFYFTLSFSGYLSGLLARAAPESFSKAYSFSDFFLYIAIGLLACTILLFCINRSLVSSFFSRN